MNIAYAPPADQTGAIPPAQVRASYALLFGVVVFSTLNAVIQVAYQISGVAVPVGAVIEAVLLLLLGKHMRDGKLWARMALLSVAWVFVAVSLLALFALYQLEDLRRLPGVAAFTVVYVVGKLLLIIAATVLMYRPAVRSYFR
ncbi:hypothetical protein GCM10023321_28830 [Pseudonocardia eucalypti]|uniref:Uncharacterized protein n=1 Tax=Pseudonocardia eucalypti TaxID=648755 RepID=A0ABP9Q123_9PSEU|nr:hypothetical protein [Pseudonocardia eucalypti]